MTTTDPHVTDRTTAGAAPDGGGSTAVGTAVHVRYFAAAAEAAGTAAEDLTLPAGASATDLLAAVRAGHGDRLARVLDISSLLVDGAVREDHGAPLTEGPPGAVVRVDVLPPFAGG